MRLAASPRSNNARLPVDAEQMRVLAGIGPANACCEQCAHLRPTAWQRPESRSLQLTTFVCVASGGNAPWSLLWDTCGLFKRA